MKGLRAAAWAAVTVLLIAAAPRPSAASAATPTAFAIVHASVVPMDSDRVLSDQTIVIAGDRIVAVGPDATTATPPGAIVFDARGLWVLPGLIDMHVHILRRDLRDYVDAGITSVRNMWGYNALPATMRAIADGTLVGPTIYSASQGLDGTPPQWPETQIVDDPAQADAIVAAQVAAGWRWLKVYNSLSLASYDAIVASANARGIRFVGHVSDQVPIEHALDAGQASIEHLRGYDFALQRNPGPLAAWADIDATRIPALAAHTAAAGTWNCPTIAVFDVIARGLSEATRAQVVANRALMIRALHEAGARLLAGTDSGIDLAVPGESIHTELAGLVAAGLSNYEALRAATSGAAEFLEETAEIGIVAPGRRADLLVVADNPLENLEALRLVEAVLLRGVWFGRRGPRFPPPSRANERGAPRTMTRPTP